MSDPILAGIPGNLSPLERLQRNEVEDFHDAMRCLIAVCDQQAASTAKEGAVLAPMLMFADAGQMKVAARHALGEYKRALDLMEAKLALDLMESTDPLVRAIGETLTKWDYSDLVL